MNSHGSEDLDVNDANLFKLYISKLKDYQRSKLR